MCRSRASPGGATLSARPRAAPSGKPSTSHTPRPPWAPFRGLEGVHGLPSLWSAPAQNILLSSPHAAQQGCRAARRTQSPTYSQALQT